MSAAGRKAILGVFDANSADYVSNGDGLPLEEIRKMLARLDELDPSSSEYLGIRCGVMEGLAGNGLAQFETGRPREAEVTYRVFRVMKIALDGQGK